MSWGCAKCDAEVVGIEGDSVPGTHGDAVGRNCCSLN